MVKKKLLVRAGWAIAFGAILTGCATGENKGASQPTTVKWFMWSGSQSEVDAWEHIADMVHERYPEIKVDFETASFGDYFTKLATQSGSDEAACLLGMQSLFLPGFSEALAPLDNLADAGIDLGEFDKSIVDGLNYDGVQYAVPYDFGPLNIYFNKSAFEEAGVPEPSTDWTTADFEEAAAALTGDGTYGFAAGPYPNFIVPFQLSEYGTQFVNSSGDLEMNGRGFKPTMEWYADLVLEQRVAPEVPATNDTNWATSQFQSGRAAMVIDGPWNLINLKTTSDFDLGIATIPRGESGSRTVSFGSGFGLSAGCAEPKAALKALSVITGVDAARYLAELGRAFPARTELQSVWFDTADMPGAQEVLEATLADAEALRPTANWSQFSQVFQQQAIQVMNRQTSVEAFVNAVESQSE